MGIRKRGKDFSVTHESVEYKFKILNQHLSQIIRCLSWILYPASWIWSYASLGINLIKKEE